jgi:thiol-disulfide isomerase/thioredoxin
MNAIVIGIILVLVFVLLYMLFNTGSSSKSLEPPVATLQPRPESISAKPVAPTVAASSTSNKVIELNTGAEANEFLAKHEGGILLVYAPWCGHCRMMMPDFESASNETAVKFARLDGAKAQDFMREKEIRGFPTLFTVNNKGKSDRWMGGRDKASLLSGTAPLLTAS